MAYYFFVFWPIFSMCISELCVFIKLFFEYILNLSNRSYIFKYVNIKGPFLHIFLENMFLSLWNHLYLILWYVKYVKIFLYEMFPLLCALTGGILKTVLSSFRDIIIGVLAGAILGTFVRYFPSEDQVNKKFIFLEVYY